MSEDQVANTIQQLIEQSTKSKEQYINSLKEKLELLESWNLNDGDRLHKIQRIHLLHTWCGDVLNAWKKWLIDVNRVATFSEEETNNILNFYFGLATDIIAFELSFCDSKMGEDISKMKDEYNKNKPNKGIKDKYVV